LGSNIGDRIGFIRNAVEEIRKDVHCKVKLVSAVYETAPYGNSKQPNFYNAVIMISTNYTLEELFSFLKGIELKLGRKDSVRWGPREIDLDILFFDEIIYSENNLKVPHPGVHLRDFVLVPLVEIAPNLIHPELKEKIIDICKRNSEKNVIQKLSEKI
jgi:2-amino-4-hydroxy-6-hydroxymethyldihydropteridine diphosphokinase